MPVIIEALFFSLSLGCSFSLNYFSTFSTKIFIVLFMEVPPPHFLYLLLLFFVPEKECRSGVDHLETGNHRLTLVLPTNSVIITCVYLDISAYCRSTFNLSLIIFLLKGCHLFSNFYFIFTSTHSPCLKFPTLRSTDQNMARASAWDDRTFSLHKPGDRGSGPKDPLSHGEDFHELAAAWGT